MFEQVFPIFREPELLAAIRERAKVMKVGEGEVLLRKDAYVKVVPLVLQGLVKVLQEGEEHDHLLYYLEPGDGCIMSVTACFNNEKSRIKAVVEEDATILAVPAEQVVTWSASYPSWNEFITTLYRKRFVNLLDGFNSVVYDRVDQRLAAYLDKRAHTLGTRELVITHKQIAEDLGSAREVISRLLKVMESEGKVELQRGRIVLL